MPRVSALDRGSGAHVPFTAWLLRPANLWLTIGLLTWLAARRARGDPARAVSKGASRDAPPQGAAPRDAPPRDDGQPARSRAVGGISLWDRDSVKAVPVLVVILLLLKAYVIAGYSLVTASALVTAAPVAVLVGTVTSFLHIVVLVLFLITSVWLYRHWRDSKGHSNRPGDVADLADHGSLRRPTAIGALDAKNEEPHKEVTLLVFAVWVMCLIFLPVPMSIPIYKEESLREIGYTIAVCAGGVALYGISNYFAKRRKRPRVESGWFVVLVGVALVVPTMKTPWMPSEVWILDQPIAPHDLHDLPPKRGDEEKALTRYPVVFVLSVDNNWAVGLDVNTRLILEIPAENLKGRVVCKHADQPANTLPLYAFLVGDKWETPNKYCGNLFDPPGQLDNLIPKDTENNSTTTDSAQ